MKTVLFARTHNAGRSQMAEAFFNPMAPDDVRRASMRPTRSRASSVSSVTAVMASAARLTPSCALASTFAEISRDSRADA